VGANAQTSLWQTGFAEYQIQPRLKDKAGDPIRVSVIPGSAGMIQHDGTEYDASSTNWIEARIGDVIGLQLLRNDFSGGWTGPAEYRGMVGSYLFYTGESGFKSLGLSIGLTGGLSESAPIAATMVNEAGAYLFDEFFPEGSTGEFGVDNPVWIEMDTVSHDYEISITDNALVSLTLPSYLPGAPEMRVMFLNPGTGEWEQAGYDDGDGNFFYFPGGEVMFDLPVTLVRLENIGWDLGDLPATFALGLQFVGTGTEVSVLPTSPIPEPGIAGFLLVILGVVLVRRRRRG
jgi:MYXO-CTERM domain-containing protein